MDVLGDWVVLATGGSLIHDDLFLNSLMKESEAYGLEQTSVQKL